MRKTDTVRGEPGRRRRGPGLWLVVAILTALATVAVAVTAAEVTMAKVAEPPYETLRTDGEHALRRYAPMIVASVDVGGSRSQAVGAGFRILANYIFGGNVPAEKIAMTAPVLQQPATGGSDASGTRIAMTAPVVQRASGAGWTVSFVMPAGSTLGTLPRPQSGRVRLSEVPAETVAVSTFSWFPTEGRLAAHAGSLADWMAAEGVTAAGPPRFAYYDPPWTLPFLRRNEVMIPVTGR